jgi:hypothetical protein
MVLPIISLEVLEEIVAAASSLLLPVLGKTLGLERILEPLMSRRKHPGGAASTADLLKRLRAASSEIDVVIGELRAAADERLAAVATLESSINELTEKEHKLRERIEGTEGLSKATVEAMAKIIEEKLEKSEKPKRRRDYALFAAGVLVSAIVGIGIEVTKPIWTQAFHINGHTAQEESTESTGGQKVQK